MTEFLLKNPNDEKEKVMSYYSGTKIDTLTESRVVGSSPNLLSSFAKSIESNLKEARDSIKLDEPKTKAPATQPAPGQ